MTCAIALTVGAAVMAPRTAQATAGNVAIGSIPLPAKGSVPVRVAFTPDGTKAYVSDQAHDAVVRIDTSTHQTKTISLSSIGGFPTNLAVSADGKKLYVLNQNPGSVAVIDTSTDTLASANGGQVAGYKGDNPYGIAVATTQNIAFVTNNDTNASVSIIDTSSDAKTSDTQIGTVSGFPQDDGALGVAFSSDDSVAYIAHATGVSVVGIGPGSGTYKQEVAHYSGDTPLNIAFVPGGGYQAYVVNQDQTGQDQAGSVSVIDKSNGNYEQTGTVSNFTGQAPANVAITPDGKTAYVTNYVSNTVSVIDVGTQAQAATIGMGKFNSQNPNGLAFRRQTNDKIQTADLAYIANGGSGNVTVIQLPMAAAITRIVPNRGAAFGGNTVTINGLHLTDTSSVYFGAISAQIKTVTDTAVVVVTPASVKDMPGFVDVKVENPGGDAHDVNGFQYVTSLPTRPAP